MTDRVSGNQMEEVLMDIIKMRDEPLHPDLAPYLIESNAGMPLLAHRLVHQVMPINGHANRLYEQKSQMLAEAEADEDWSSIIHILIERPYRCEALIDYVMGRDEYDMPLPMKGCTPEVADLVAFVWTDSENIHQHVDDWLAITEGHLPGEPLLMGDQEAFDALPVDEHGRLEVWRGDCNDGGWSWTLDEKVARFFCARWGEDNDLLHGWVDKRYVFGYLTNRSESEVMVRREHVQDLSRTPYES